MEASIIDRLSHSRQRIDQGPNKEIARQLATTGDMAAVKELIALLLHPDKRVVYDVLLVLAHLAELDPLMVSVHLSSFFPMTSSTINSHIWASMIVISRITRGNESVVFEHLSEILNGMSRSTVVARDHGVRILVQLYQHPEYCEDVFTLYLEQLYMAPDNQLGQYALRIYPYIKPIHRPDVIRVLEERESELVNETHRRRITKILKRYYNQKRDE